MTLQQLEWLPDDDLRYELDEGELIASPPACKEHGEVACEVFLLVATYCRQRDLGKVYPPDVGFVLDEDTVRSPDVAFVRKGRQGGPPGFFQGAPDLAVEVFSPSDSVPQLMRKVEQYRRTGTHTISVVYPDRRDVHVFRGGAEPHPQL